MNALNFIGGVFVEAHDGGTIANINPATGEEIGRITRSNMADVEAPFKHRGLHKTNGLR